MTNQNDTQDEAERLADLYIVREFRSDSDERDELFMERTTIYKEGYRAGVASREPEIAELEKLIQSHGVVLNEIGFRRLEMAALHDENDVICGVNEKVGKDDVGKFIAQAANNWLTLISALEKAVEAHKSIAANACCGRCQEAALVSQKTLAEIAAMLEGK